MVGRDRRPVSKLYPPTIGPESYKQWASAYENYTFEATAHGTRLTIHLDVTDDWERNMVKAWPKALAKLKVLAESSQ